MNRQISITIKVQNKTTFIVACWALVAAIFAFVFLQVWLCVLVHDYQLKKLV
jgi:hypothetical protein